MATISRAACRPLHIPQCSVPGTHVLSTPSRSSRARSAYLQRGRRHNSSVSAPSRDQAIKAAQARLKPVLDHLPRRIDWAVAYGSGVIHQANASATGPPPMTDFLISTNDPLEFHRENIEINPSHYPAWARITGAKGVTGVMEKYGAGLWYVTMVDIGGLQVKYGVISSPALERDLTDWETLYVAGRMHKPVLPLLSTPSIDTAQKANISSALATSLLLLPYSSPFTEHALWEQIAGISYSGDPRMSVPGAENPEKVKNIVRGDGNLVGFRQLYGAALRDLRDTVGWEDGNESLLEWRGLGEQLVRQEDSVDFRSSLAASLPLEVRYSLAKGFNPSIARSSSLARPIPLSSKDQVTDALSKLDQQFWADVVSQNNFRKVFVKQLKDVMHGPALSQSAKGLVTAGMVKSVQYSMAKFRKWLASRNKRSSSK